MGKWSTYKRRGSTGISNPGLGHPPPAPLARSQGGYVESVAQGLDDYGGTLYCSISLDHGMNWQAPTSFGWQRVVDWYAVAGHEGQWFRFSEAGNGTTYLGTSDWSNILELPD